MFPLAHVNLVKILMHQQRISAHYQQAPAWICLIKRNSTYLTKPLGILSTNYEKGICVHVVLPFCIGSQQKQNGTKVQTECQLVLKETAGYNAIRSSSLHFFFFVSTVTPVGLLNHVALGFKDKVCQKSEVPCHLIKLEMIRYMVTIMVELGQFLFLSAIADMICVGEYSCNRIQIVQ